MKILRWLIGSIYLLDCALFNLALASPRQLEQLVQNAQSHYFSGSPIAETQRAFEAITERTELLGSDADSQDVFYFSFLRRAQLAVDDIDRDKWMNKALIFDWMRSPDPQLFSPEFREKYSELKSKLRFRHFRCSKFRLDVEPMFVNGRAVQCSQNQFRVPKSRYLIWSKSSPSSRVVRAEAPEKLLPTPDHPPVNLAGSITSTTSGDSKMKTTQLELKELTPEISLADQAVATIENNHKGITAFETADVSTAPKKPSFLRNKWLWIGIGVITTGVLLSQAQRSAQEPKTRPSTREGL